jgi:hypothetical protein
MIISPRSCMNPPSCIITHNLSHLQIGQKRTKLGQHAAGKSKIATCARANKNVTTSDSGFKERAANKRKKMITRMWVTWTKTKFRGSIISSNKVLMPHRPPILKMLIWISLKLKTKTFTKRTSSTRRTFTCIEALSTFMLAILTRHFRT